MFLGYNMKPRRARHVLETANYVSGIAGLPAAGTHVVKAVSVVHKGIATGAKKTGVWAAKWGWTKLAALCFKLAAASPLIAQIAVGAVVVVAAVCIFQVVRSA
jgi:hypothetical protein